jgi:hypothetical protein
MSPTHRQEPPRPPSPEPTIVVYENITNPSREDNHHHHDHDHDPTRNLSLWSTISVRLVGSHPLWGHYLYVQFYDVIRARDTRQRTGTRTKNCQWILNLNLSLFLFFI